MKSGYFEYAKSGLCTEQATQSKSSRIIKIKWNMYSRHSVNGPSDIGNVQLTDIYLSGNRKVRLWQTIWLPD